jgi:hypothetical protein
LIRLHKAIEESNRWDGFVQKVAGKARNT